MTFTPIHRFDPGGPRSNPAQLLQGAWRSKMLRRNSVLAISAAVFFSVSASQTNAEPMWEKHAHWRCTTSLFIENPPNSKTINVPSVRNQTLIDWNAGTIVKILGGANNQAKALRGRIISKSYMSNPQQRVYETHWIVEYDGVGKVSGMATKYSGQDKYYAGKLAPNIQNEAIYGNGEICYPD
jgi:hypothetical protein